jgi:hypothetical protein
MNMETAPDPDDPLLTPQLWVPVADLNRKESYLRKLYARARARRSVAAGVPEERPDAADPA